MGYTAIVVGATGLVGRALVDQLANNDNVEKIITITRRPAVHASAKVCNHVVNFEQLQDHASLFRADLLFSSLGSTLKQAGSVAARRTVDFDYSYKVAELAAAQGVRHYLLVSSGGANIASYDPYMRTKGELEQKIRELPFERISIFQPSMLLGKREHLRVGELVGSWILPTLCKLPMLRRFRPISGAEVAAKMIQVSQQPGKAVEIFTFDEIFVV